eukprot:PhM_4_TR3737/c0_g1_i1/m.14960/K19680/TRAF3IP1, IFT54; TRAF3-interacting protein 1
MSEAPAWVVATQRSLGEVIKAPKLTEKLLQKPPVKFIHDIVTNCMKATGFPEGLFTAEELDPANLKDRDQKLGFIQKLINVAQCGTGKTTACRASKVISGAEPENTNEVLQMLAQCATLPKDKMEAAVKAALKRRGSTAAEAPPQQQQAPAEPKAPEAAPVKEPEAPPKKVEEPPKAAAQPPPQQAPREKTPPGQATPPKTQQTTAPPPQQAERPGTVDGRRPPSAAVIPAAGVIVEGKADADDDEPVESVEQRAAKILANAEKQKQETQANRDEARGYFAREAMKEKEEDQAKEAQQGSEKPSQGIILKSRRRGSHAGQREDLEAEIQTLRDQLQTLSKVTNPIGQFMDHTAEDVDAMIRELEQWKAEYNVQVQRYHDTQRENEEAMRPLRAEIAEVDHKIQEQVQQTNMLRAQICANDATIENMLRMITNADAPRKR